MEEIFWCSNCQKFEGRNLVSLASLFKRKPWKIWNELKGDLVESTISRELSQDRNAWDSFLKTRLTYESVKKMSNRV